MNSPTEQREKKIEAAAKARTLMAAYGKSTNLEARATALHDRVSEGIKTICATGSCFDAKQTETLTEIAVHLALLFDNDMQLPTGFWGRLKRDWAEMGAASRVVFMGVVVALLVGVGTLGIWAYQLSGVVPQPGLSEPLSEANEIPKDS